MFMLSQMSHWIVAHGSEAITFILVLARAGGLIVGAPFWGSRMVPLPVRIWIAMVLAIATYPLVQIASVGGVVTLLSMALAIVGEIFLGLVLGWVAQLLFAGMRLAGQ